MFSISTILLLLATASAGSGSSVDDAAALLSRFPPGSIPASPRVLEAIGALTEHGDEDHIDLLQSLVEDESAELRIVAVDAIEGISQRARVACRTAYTPPLDRDVARWISRHQPVGPQGETLGRAEQRAVAYTALVLAESLVPLVDNWRSLGQLLETQDEPQTAIRLYATAIINGELDAVTYLEAFDVDTETLLLGLLTALPSNHPTKPVLITWLTAHGSIATVNVLSNRAMRMSTIERAGALNALSTMIREGRLNTGADSAARGQIESSTLDPHQAVRTFAQTTLIELAQP